MKKTAIGLLLAGALIFSLAVADLMAGETKGREVIVTGMNYCFGCDLKKAHGAHAQCDLFGHKHALKVINIQNSAGKALHEHDGKALHYLLNTESASLWNGEKVHGKKLTIKGLLYSDDRVVEVKSFEVTP